MGGVERSGWEEAVFGVMERGQVVQERKDSHAIGDPDGSDRVPLDGALCSEEGIRSGELNLQILDRKMQQQLPLAGPLALC